VTDNVVQSFNVMFGLDCIRREGGHFETW